MSNSSTLPWTGKSAAENTSSSNSASVPTFSLHKTRSSPSIFAMTAKSAGMALDLPIESCSTTISEINSDYQQIQSNHTSSVTQSDKQIMSPNSLRRSLTMDYDCDWTKSSTMPHDLSR